MKKQITKAIPFIGNATQRMPTRPPAPNNTGLNSYHQATSPNVVAVRNPNQRSTK
jgi:hypothetical protein